MSASLAAMTSAGYAADAPVTDWPSYNRTLTSDRYVPMDQINKGNVANLKQLCVYDLNIDTSFQTGPIVVGHTLYATSEKDTVAIDAATCKEKWRVHEDVPTSGLAVNRGAAYLDGRIFRGMLDGRVLAYDAETGKKLWETKIADPANGESVPAAPIAWNGMVFIGNAGSDRYGVKGRIYALDAKTGKTKWETYTVPSGGIDKKNKKMEDLAKTTWGNAPNIPITGGGTWTSYALDPSRGLLFVPVGNPGPDFANQVRPGSNLYTNSILILDAKTGVYRSHFSLVPADFHDWDLAATPAVVTTKDGKRLVAGAPKDGRLYVYDLATNKAVFAPVDIAIQENRDTPLSTTPTHFCPGTAGGTEWNGPSFSPEANAFYDGTVNYCVTVTLDPKEITNKKAGQAWVGTVPTASFGVKDLNWSGQVVATDAVTGQKKWEYKTNAPVLSGITPTKGGLVFAGDMDKNAYAFDAETGKVLWTTVLPGAPGGGVLSYSVDGKQFVTFVAGTRGSLFPVTPASAKIVVYGLQ